MPGENRGIKVVYQSVSIEIALGPSGSGLLLPVESKRGGIVVINRPVAVCIAGQQDCGR